MTLSFLDLGAASYTVHGTKRERSRLEAQLDGSLEIVSPDPDAVIAVAVDGEARGFAPVRVEGLAPGAHEVRFSGPGMASWGQTVEIKVHEQRQIFTRPLQSPATGLIQIRATRAEDGETKPLQGARVWLDGQPRGATPITLELPRGPHSVRVSFQGEEAPVQVIDLPGGNQRFATFEFGLDGLLAQQRHDRFDIGFHVGQLYSAEPHRPPAGKTGADPEIDPPRRELVELGGARERGVQRPARDVAQRARARRPVAPLSDVAARGRGGGGRRRHRLPELDVRLEREDRVLRERADWPGRRVLHRDPEHEGGEAQGAVGGPWPQVVGPQDRGQADPEVSRASTP